MKLILALGVFILALSLTFKTVAEEKAHGGGHNDLSNRMNSLFPEKQKNPALGQTPLSTKILSPKFLSKVSGPVKLEWSPTSSATNYHVQVATDPNFKWLVLNEYFAKGTSLDLPNTESGKRYFWRVAAVKDDNVSMHTKSQFVDSAFDVK